MYIGIDLGGTNIAAGIVDFSGNIIYSDSCKTNKDKDPEVIIKDIIELVEDIIQKSNVDISNIKSIGIGIPGIANKDGVVIRCINLKWRMVSLKKPLEEYFNLPVYIDNDASVAGLAEFKKGSLKTYQNSLLLTLGTGIGAGIIINGKIYSGAHGIGAEIGHIIVGKNFYECNCGNNGCLETFASSTGLIKYVEEILDEGGKSEYLEKHRCEINAKVIIEGLKLNDYICNKAYERFIKYLVIGIKNIINILDPEVIAFGGGISNMGDKLLNDLKEELAKGYNKDLPMPELVLAHMKNDAGIIGAALMGEF